MRQPWHTQAAWRGRACRARGVRRDAPAARCMAIPEYKRRREATFFLCPFTQCSVMYATPGKWQSPRHSRGAAVARAAVFPALFQHVCCKREGGNRTAAWQSSLPRHFSFFTPFAFFCQQRRCSG